MILAALAACASIDCQPMVQFAKGPTSGFAYCHDSDVDRGRFDHRSDVLCEGCDS